MYMRSSTPRPRARALRPSCGASHSRAPAARPLPPMPATRRPPPPAPPALAQRPARTGSRLERDRGCTRHLRGIETHAALPVRGQQRGGIVGVPREEPATKDSRLSRRALRAPRASARPRGWWQRRGGGAHWPQQRSMTSATSPGVSSSSPRPPARRRAASSVCTMRSRVRAAASRRQAGSCARATAASESWSPVAWGDGAIRRCVWRLLWGAKRGAHRSRPQARGRAPRGGRTAPHLPPTPPATRPPPRRAPLPHPRRFPLALRSLKGPEDAGLGARPAAARRAQRPPGCPGRCGPPAAGPARAPRTAPERPAPRMARQGIAPGRGEAEMPSPHGSPWSHSHRPSTTRPEQPWRWERRRPRRAAAGRAGR
jgi:hypothetical protein